MLILVITLWEIVGKPENFLPKVTFSETFWQLDCQIAALFPPMQPGLAWTKTLLAKGGTGAELGNKCSTST